MTMNSDRIRQKREMEQKTVEMMIAIYCRGKHQSAGMQLCPECRKLLMYAKQRSERCPFMEKKTFCSNCRVHCYRPEMREKIREVMRYSGPRMLLYRPDLALWHVISSVREKKKNGE